MGGSDQAAAAGGGADVVALAADLMFGSKIRGTARMVGAEVVLASSARALLDKVRQASPRLVLVDLDARGLDAGALITELKSDASTAAIPVVGFVSHVNADAIAQARRAGADQVLARSAFVRELPELLRRAAAGPDEAGTP